MLDVLIENCVEMSNLRFAFLVLAVVAVGAVGGIIVAAVENIRLVRDWKSLQDRIDNE